MKVVSLTACDLATLKQLDPSLWRKGAANIATPMHTENATVLYTAYNNKKFPSANCS